MATIQAPSRNFVLTITTATTPVISAPTPLTTARHRQPDVRKRHQCRTIPDCDNVNEMNTPTAYRGIIRWVEALKTTSRTIATRASPMIPLEYTSRSPLLVSWRGR